MVNIQPALSKLKERPLSGPKIVIAAASLITIAITTVEMWRGALTIGLNWDEPTHVEAFEEWRNGEWSPTSKFGLSSFYPAYTYGFSFQILAASLNFLRSNSDPFTAEAYAVRHLSLWVLFILACAAVFVISSIITEDRIIGLFSAAFLCALPTFVGHSFINPVDTPPAVGYTLLSCGAIMMLNKSSSCNKNQRFSFLAAVILILIGTWLATGTRFAFWVPLLLTSAGVSVFLLFSRQTNSSRSIPFALAPVLSFLVGIALVAATHPHFAVRFESWVTQSVFTSGDFPYPGGTLTLNQVRVATELEWWYLPLWVGASVPAGLLALVLFGLASWLFALFRNTLSSTQIAIRLVVLAQAFGLGLGAIALSATMYNAQRHHLYVYPSLAILGGSGLALLNSHSQAYQSSLRRLANWGVSLIAGLALLYPTIERLRLFPYEYVYLNEIAARGGINGQWETDYWATSFREALMRVPNDVPLEVIGPQEFLTIYPHLRGTDADTTITTSPSEYWRIQITNGGMRLPENCRDVDSVTRNFRGEDVVMSWVGICKEMPGGRSATQ